MAAEETEYRVIPSLGRGLVRYALDGELLHVESEKRGERRSIPLADVRLVRLTRIQGVGRCELHTRGGDKLVILSRHVRGAGDFVDQEAQYAPFVRALHARLAAAAPRARYLAGTSFGFALGVLALVVGGPAAIVAAVMLAQGRTSSGLRLGAPLLGVLVFGVPMVLAGRAKAYRPEAPPADLLP